MRNGAAVYAVACLAWLGVVALLLMAQGYPLAMHTLAVPAAARPLSDMRMALDGIEAAGRGQDVIGATYKPTDHFAIRFPYHRSWLVLQHLGLRGSQTEVLTIILSLAMLIHFGVLIAATSNDAATGLVMATFACSPPIMLAIDRGNPDMLLYLLLAVGCHLLVRPALPAQIVGAVVLFAAGALKFVPFGGALGILPGNQPRRRCWLLAAFLLGALLFLVIERSEVRRITGSPYASSDWASFGSAVSVNTLARLFTRVTLITVPAWITVFIRACGILALGILSWRLARKMEPNAAWGQGQGDLAAAGFATAAGIFVGSFILIRSFNYKFLFLALAIPALCRWARRCDTSGLTARWTLATLLVWMWSGLNGYFYLVTNVFLSWVCVIGIASLLAAWLGSQWTAITGKTA
jgi:hypothetical protein